MGGFLQGHPRLASDAGEKDLRSRLTYSEIHDLVRKSKQDRLDYLDAQMLFKYRTGQDYSRLKERKIYLLRRIAVKANSIFLDWQRSLH